MLIETPICSKLLLLAIKLLLKEVKLNSSSVLSSLSSKEESKNGRKSNFTVEKLK